MPSSSSHLARKALLLVDFKLEFGRAGRQAHAGRRDQPGYLPPVGRRDAEKLDKDRFRQDLGGVEEAYQEVYQ
mgnify:CR=1 FL=1